MADTMGDLIRKVGKQNCAWVGVLDTAGVPSMGLAVFGERGYYPGEFTFATFEDACNHADKLNESMFGHTLEQSMRIIGTTMSFGAYGSPS